MMPTALLTLLERRYLTDFDESQWRLGTTVDDQVRPVLREVKLIGRSPSGRSTLSMASVLAGCHSRGNGVVFAVHGDGQRHRVMFGSRRISTGAEGSAEDHLLGISGALSAYAPGLVLSDPMRMDAQGHNEILAAIQGAPALGVITGTPTHVAHGLSGIEQIAEAVGGARYVLMVIAEPLQPGVLDASLDRARQLRSAVHLMIRRTITANRASGASESEQSEIAPDTVAVPLEVQVALSFFALARASCNPLARVGGEVLARQVESRYGLDVPPARGSRTRGSSTTDSRGLSVELLDATAEACDEMLLRHVNRLQDAQSKGWWRTAVYVAAESDADLQSVSSALRAVYSYEGNTSEPVRVVRPQPWLVRRCMIRAQTLAMTPAEADVSHPLGESFDALATCMTSDELTTLTELPRKRIPGVEVRDVADFALSAGEAKGHKISIGHILDMHGRSLEPVTLSADTLNRHVLIGGMTGYGKTTTALRILVEARRDLDVSFLVIEPAKSEYRALARASALGGNVRVYSVGDISRGPARSEEFVPLPLRLNPFAPVAGMSLARHIDLLKAVFNAAFPMFAGMSYILEDAIIRTYEDYGWDIESSTNAYLSTRSSAYEIDSCTPTLSDVSDKIEQVLEERRYGREVHQNMGAALRSRLQSLMQGSKGTTLNTRRSVRAEELFDQPCVVELRNLGDDEEKAFVMAVLLSQLYEYAEARSAGDVTRRLRHLTLVEEAHRLLAAPRSGTGPEVGDAQAKAVGMFTDMLAEMRAYGEGFIVADQIPTKLSPELMKNSDVKILHRLVAPDDRVAIGGTINLTVDQSAHLAALSPGVAVMHTGDMGSAVLAKMSQVGLDDAATPLRWNRDYLYRQATCDSCPCPCIYYSRASRPERRALADEAIASVLEMVEEGRAQSAWELFDAFRGRWYRALPPAYSADSDLAHGLFYCVATQAASRWLDQLVDDLGQAVGLPAGRLTLHHQVLLIGGRMGRLIHEWMHLREFDERVQAGADQLKDLLANELQKTPPAEMPGCGRCTARCISLRGVSKLPKSLLESLAARATVDTPADTRARSIRSAIADALPADRQVSSDFIYCAINVALNATSDATHLVAQEVRALSGGSRTVG